ncbi:MAG: hypothetical protein M0Z75_15825, partial [Nitrospiraceae bacterium]|nr:hypothetical protein [Nitrospiraceae bacterium]
MDDCRRDRPVVWVSGPAGSGKTTLVSSYIEHSKLPCLWYQVDERDGDIASFFSFMGQAIKKVRPGVRKPMPFFTPEYRMSISVFSKNYFEEMSRRIKPPFIIVLDNYQEAPAQSRLHEAVSAGISVLPENLSLFVISRSGPHQRFSRFRANGLMGSIGWDEIRFTIEEMKGFVRDRLKDKAREIAETGLERLHAKTDGWIAGITLMLEHMRTCGIPYALDAEVRHSGIFDYFANEFFERAGEGLRNFLLRTAFLPIISTENAGKLAGTGGAAQFLENLSLNNYFTTRHSGQKAIYQYHPLFRDFLRHRAQDCLAAGELDLLKKDTANLLASAGQTEDAAELFLETGDWGELVP